MKCRCTHYTNHISINCWIL